MKGTHLLLAALALCAFELVDRAWAPRAAEPLALRWVRAAGDHPLRTLLGLALLLGCRGSPRPPGKDPVLGVVREGRHGL